jgi:hypothetical protein
MPLSAIEHALRLVTRARIERGKLPADSPASFFGGQGTGEICCVCDKPIAPDELEFRYIVEGRSYRFHRLCHALWQLECERAKALAQLQKLGFASDKT